MLLKPCLCSGCCSYLFVLAKKKKKTNALLLLYLLELSNFRHFFMTCVMQIIFVCANVLFFLHLTFFFIQITIIATNGGNIFIFCWMFIRIFYFPEYILPYNILFWLPLYFIFQSIFSIVIYYFDNLYIFLLFVII